MKPKRLMRQRLVEVGVETQIEQLQIEQTHVVAVVVSRDRRDDLRATVAAILAQQVSVKLSVLIVDSSACPTVTAEYEGVEMITLQHSAMNLGGAGGFAFGIMNALAMGADLVWLMDDDGRPASSDCLQTLLAVRRSKGLTAVAPVVLDPEDAERFSFPYPINGRYIFYRAQLSSDEYIPTFAHLFNGLLLEADLFFALGLPDVRLFLRGDEVDFLYRMRRLRLNFGTTATAHFMHPSPKNELYPIFGGRLMVVYPHDGWRRKIQYRNRGYNLIRHKRYLTLALDAVRYPIFFLIMRRFDFRGLAEWAGSMWDGMRGRVYGASMKLRRVA